MQRCLAKQDGCASDRRKPCLRAWSFALMERDGKIKSGMTNRRRGETMRQGIGTCVVVA